MRAVFPSLQSIRYCDANIPTINKIYFLVKRVDYALLSSQSISNDEGLLMHGALCDGVNDKLDTVFGEFGEEGFPSDNE